MPLWMRYHLLSCALTLVLLGPGTGHAQFTFQTPAATATTLPVTEVKVMLELSGPLPTTATVSVGGTSIPVDGTITPLPGGDLAIATPMGNNTVVLDFVLRSILANPSQDKCKLKNPGQGGATSITFTPTGFPTITGYRLTGYAAAWNDPLTCTCASRRVKAVTWLTPPPGNDRGRFPMDVILVLDKSGSMNDPTLGALTPESKWETLKTAVGEFVTVWEQEGLGAGTTGGTGLAQDRLGLIYFGSQAEPIVFGEGSNSIFVERGTGEEVHPWESIKSNLNARKQAGGTTALGGGLKAAYDAWQTEKRDTTILVMTDGMQNQLPRVDDGTGENIGLKVLAFFDQNGNKTQELALGRQCVPIITVAMGDSQPPSGPPPTTNWSELMDEISAQTSGRRNRLVAGKDTPSAFNASLVDTLKGSTLSIALNTQGTVSGGGAGSSVNKVSLDSSIRGAMVVLSWLGSRPIGRPPVDLTILKPDGTQVRPVARTDEPTYSVQRVNIPESGPAGEWTLVVRNADVSGNIPYQLSVLTEEKALDLDFNFDRLHYGTGQPITLEASVFFERKPLENLGQGLSVLIERPNSPLGTLLHDSTTPPGPPPPMDNPPPYELKLNALLQDPEFRKRVGTTPDTAPVPMRALGNGRYAVTIDDTHLPGTYRFHVLLDTKRPNGEVLRRVEMIETKVEVIPDGNSSVIQSDPLGGGDYVLTIVPRDQFGNYKGPGYDDRIHVKLDGAGKVETIADPKIDGSYKIRLSGAKDDTLIQISVGDTPLVRGTVAKPEPVRPCNKPWPGCCAHCTSADGGLLLYLVPLIALLRRRRMQRR